MALGLKSPVPMKSGAEGRGSQTVSLWPASLRERMPLIHPRNDTCGIVRRFSLRRKPGGAGERYWAALLGGANSHK